MPPIINFNICDNSADCNGITACPQGVFVWDDKNRTIKIEKERCIDCGACVNFCSVNAIRYAKNEQERKQIEDEIASDTRTIKDLFVDRYGAMPIDDKYLFELSKEKLANRINSNRPVIIEFNRTETIECLLKSVPIVDIQAKFNKDATYSRFFIDLKDMAEYGVSTTPVLRFYYGNKLLGEIGYFENKNKHEYFERITEFGKLIM